MRFAALVMSALGLGDSLEDAIRGERTRLTLSLKHDLFGRVECISASRLVCSSSRRRENRWEKIPAFWRVGSVFVVVTWWSVCIEKNGRRSDLPKQIKAKTHITLRGATLPLPPFEGALGARSGAMV